VITIGLHKLREICKHNGLEPTGLRNEGIELHIKTWRFVLEDEEMIII
jgi:hypothetical protein